MHLGLVQDLFRVGFVIYSGLVCNQFRVSLWIILGWSYAYFWFKIYFGGFRIGIGFRAYLVRDLFQISLEFIKSSYLGGCFLIYAGGFRIVLGLV